MITLERPGPWLVVALLGPPEVRWAGVAVSLARRQTRALLYLLAARPGPVPRAQLCYLFWPDIPDADARRNLTHLLTLLRRALPAPDVLLSDDTSVGLRPERAWTDASEFTRLSQGPDAQTHPTALAAALDLYRGPLLDGFVLSDCPEYEAWLDQERRVWERRVDEALVRLVERFTVARDYRAAIAAAQRGLERDPLAEELHRRLITLYAATGDRVAALRQFEQCVVALERELGVAPLPETRAVYAAVRDGGTLLQTHATPVASTRAGATREPLPAAVPASSSTLIGRDTVLGEVLALLRRPDVRLLTLAGPGGTGKTRLALEVARALAGHFADGVTFMELAPLRDAALVPRAIGAALGLSERDDRPPLLRLQEALRPRELLLVLDNLEHLLAAAPALAALLAAAPRLTLLVTSRELLRIGGEQMYPVPPLDLPDPDMRSSPEELARVGAVALLLARVRERVPGFQLTPANAADLAAICARLDGLPLAIELAAARAALLSPRMLLARLDRRLALLTDGPRDLPERQRTLRATLDWSYHLLDLAEQILLGRLAVFAGGWTLEAAEHVTPAVGPLTICVLDGLHALLNKHLVARTAGADGEPRFHMLETIREYALEQLGERGEVALAQAAHAGYFRALAARAEPLLRGPGQQEWLNRLDEEHPNLRVAMAWLLETGEAVAAMQLAASLYWLWYVRGHFGEGQAWLSQTLRAVEPLADAPRALRPTGPDLAITRVRYALAHLTLLRGNLAEAHALFARQVANLRALAGTPGGAERAVRELLVWALLRLLQVEGMTDQRPAPELISELLALVQSLDDPLVAAEVAHSYGRGLLYGANAPELARPQLAQAELFYRARGDHWMLAMLAVDLGMLALLDDDLAQARRRFDEARAGAVALRDRFLEAEALNNLGETARMLGEDAVAEAHYAASLERHQDLGSQVEAQRLHHNLAYLALHRVEIERARAGFAASLRGFGAIGQLRGQAEALAGLACVAVHTPHDAARAAHLWGAADTLHATTRTTPWPADQAERARYEPLARAQLGDGAYESAYAAGERLTLEQATQHASPSTQSIQSVSGNRVALSPLPCL